MTSMYYGPPQKAGMGVYPMDLADEAEGISYSCPKCNKTMM